MLLPLLLLPFIISASFTFWSISDIHVDPYFGTPNGTCHSPTTPPPTSFTTIQAIPGCDPGPQLLPALFGLPSTPTFHQCPDAVLLPGDLVRHGEGRASPAAARAVMSAALPNVYGPIHDALSLVCQSPLDIPFVWAICNNDLYPRYPPPPPPGKADAWLTYLQAEWPPLARATAAGSSGVASFATTGCSNFTAGNSVHLVAVHSNYWASEAAAKRALGGEPLHDDPAGIFAWLRQTLDHSLAANLPTVIVGHIPPGVDHHSLTMAWHPAYRATYVQTLEEFVQRGGQLIHSSWGHEHIVTQRVVGGSATAMAGMTHFLSGSLSPIFGNNPTIRHLTLTVGTNASGHRRVTGTPSRQPTVTTTIQDYYIDLASNSTKLAPLYGCGDYSCYLSVAQPLTAADLHKSLWSSTQRTDEYLAISSARASPVDMQQHARTWLPDESPAAASSPLVALLCSTFCENATSCLALDPSKCPIVDGR
mmetsp:Transcript_12200/g.38680  ORF Transcript_12200/g.38680 Transcript_12200/m.38680 type:complete len:478 (-) Transcript_12200:858-2291(-)